MRKQTANQAADKQTFRRTCDECNIQFKSVKRFNTHVSRNHQSFVCNKCNHGFRTKAALERHVQQTHRKRSAAFTCQTCSRSFSSRSQMKKHELKDHYVTGWRMKTVNVSHSPFREVSSAHERFLRVFYAPSERDDTNPITTIDELNNWIKPHMENLLANVYRAMDGAYKYFITLHVSFTDVKNDNTIKNGYLQTKMRSCYSIVSAEEEAEQALAELRAQDASRAKSDATGSQWVLRSIDAIYVNVSKYQSYMGGSKKKKQLQTDELPELIVNKKCLHIEQWTRHCLFYCIAASGVLSQEDSEAMLKEETLVQYKTVTAVSQIGEIEKNWQIGINVYSFNDEHGFVFPVRVNHNIEVDEDPANDKIVNVFLYNSHYYLIKNFNSFAGSGGKRINKYCFFCLNSFATVDSCRSHMKICRTNTPATLVVPSCRFNAPPAVSFSNYSNCYKQPYVVYADFESLLVPQQHNTTTHRHDIFAYAFVMINKGNHPIMQKIYIQTSETTAWKSKGKRKGCEDYIKLSPAADMLRSLFKVYRVFDELITTKVPMTAVDERQFEAASQCHICRQECDSNSKVRDHDHQTGLYRGAAHDTCNLLYSPSQWLTVVMHNLSNYDMHPLMVGLSEIKHQIEKVSVIPVSSEKYTSMTIISKCGAKIRFVDSLRFLNASLENLSASLVKEQNPFSLLKQFFPRCHHLLRGKQVFPYEYLSSYAALKDKTLPPLTAFYNSLSKTSISKEDYKHAQQVWSEANCASLKDYVKLYLWTDVLLLAEVFESFRHTSHMQYGLDPIHYISMPQLAFDAALFKTRVKLELMTDIDQILFVKQGIRGGVSMISHRYSQANNPLMDTYDSSEAVDKYIMYADINNLYGYAMSQHLPVGKFKWIDESHFDDIMLKIVSYSPYTSSIGWIVELDLEYPEELHDDHNDLPLAPEKITIDDSYLSDYQLKLRDSKSGLSKKLVPHFMNRSHYVVHFAALRYYIDNNMIPGKIYRILQFKQEPWLEPYIDMNTELRKNSRSAFEKDMYKLMNNAVYGKTMENVWNRYEVKICWNKEQLLKFSSKPWYRCFHIMDTDISVCIMKQRRITLNKPLYLGMSILDISKVIFYQTFYDGFKALWPHQMKLLMVDTDSYIMEVCVPKGDSIYKQLYEYMQTEEYAQGQFRLDCSNYCEDDQDKHIRLLASQHECDRQLGAVKDEMGSTIITEFIGLRPKLYAIRRMHRQSRTPEEIIKAKGTPKAVVKTSINFQHFSNMLTDSTKSLSFDVTHIRSREHMIGTIVSKKRCLSIADDKRFIDPQDHISTLALGHKRIKQDFRDVNSEQ